MLEYNGKMYARVSDIIKPFVNFGAVPQDVLDYKASIGTSVHQAIQEEIEGMMPAPILQARGYVKSFEKWRVALSPVFVETEVRYYCDHLKITGQIDALIKLEGDEPAILIDFKTSANESSISWPMQAHLYHYLLEQSNKSMERSEIQGISKRFLFIKLDKWGNLPKVFEYKFDANIMAKCLIAVEDFWKCVDPNHR